MWTIERTGEIAEWITPLDDDAKEVIYKNLFILKDIGPSLGRPYVDSVKESKYERTESSEQKKVIPIIPCIRSG